MRNGVLVGLHQDFGPREREALVSYLEEFVRTRATLTPMMRQSSHLETARE